MNKNVSPKDLKSISAYLDGQLSSIERKTIETRFKNEEKLQQAFVELQQTKLLLKHATTKKVPRNFTLTPEMATQIKPLRKYRMLPALSISSGLATFLLVFALVFEMLPGFINQKTSKQFAPELNMAMEAAPAAESFDMESDLEPPIIIEWGDPTLNNNEGYGRGGGNNADPAIESLTVPEPETIVEITEESIEQELFSPETAGGGGGEPPKMAPQGTEQPQATLSKQQTVEPVTGTGPILGIRSEEETDIYNDSVLNILDDKIQSYQNPTIEQTPLIRWLQISLASIAIITGISALLIRRKSKF